MVTVPSRKRGSDRSTILDIIITKQPDKITEWLMPLARQYLLLVLCNVQA